jgi:pyruvate formate lyase activating enzyme
MQSTHAARFWQPVDGGKVLCTLCPHDCRIGPGGRGACAVRYNEGGKLYTLVYDKVVARHLDPVEKKPLFHFFPGSTAYSIGTVGCNLRCAFCQNWQIAQWPKQHLAKGGSASDAADAHEPICPPLAELERAIPGERVTPKEIVAAALRSGARSIAYTYTEPTIFYELAYDTAVLARKRGLKNIFVSNGFIGEAAQRELATVLDAVNVDLKGFREAAYRRVSRARLEPVLESIVRYRELGVWVEVTTLVVPGLNDSDEELDSIAKFLAAVGPDVPWHVSQFYPAYKMLDTPVTPVARLRRAVEIGRAAGLRYIYEGNVPGEKGENTHCHKCAALLVERYGFHIRRNAIRDAACPQCHAKVAGVGMAPEPAGRAAA